MPVSDFCDVPFNLCLAEVLMRQGVGGPTRSIIHTAKRQQLVVQVAKTDGT
jgi:hypothetical protein